MEIQYRREEERATHPPALYLIYKDCRKRLNSFQVALKETASKDVDESDVENVSSESPDIIIFYASQTA